MVRSRKGRWRGNFFINLIWHCHFKACFISQIERIIQASGQRGCQNMLIHSAGKSIQENHVWFSIFFKSVRSRYTRVQRTSTAFAMLYLAMLADAMWYGIVSEQITSGWFRLGFLSVSPEQMYIGFIISCITMVPTIIIMFLFKTARRSKLRENRIDKALSTDNFDALKDGSIESSELETKPTLQNNDENQEEEQDSGNEGSASDSEESSSDSDDSKSEDSDESSEKDSDNEDAEKDAEKDSNNEDTEIDAENAVAEKDSDKDDSQENSSNESSDEESDESSENSSDDSSSESSNGSKSSGEDSDTESIKSKTINDESKEEAKLEIESKPINSADETVEIIEIIEHKEKSKVYRHFTLPFVFRYLAWVLCLLIIIASAFFIILYGLTFGNDKTHQWLTSIIVAFFIGILIIEPLKIALFSCCLSVLCKNSIDLDETDDVEDDEIDPTLSDDSMWESNDSHFRESKEPIDEIKLDLIRLRMQKELETWAIVKELTSFFFFIVIAFLVNYMNRDLNCYRFQHQLRHNFIYKNGFDKVRTSNDLWKWMHITAVTELKAAAWYNGQPPYGMRGYIGDMQSRVMGYGTLRQVRVKPNSCRVHRAVLNLTQECAQGSIFVNEDDNDYCNAWVDKNELTEFLPSCTRPEFKYTTAKELDSMPYTAKIDMYGGGGYVYHVKGSSKEIRHGMKHLQQQRWINNHTRAVFLEFSVYNPNVNLFCIATIVAEFIPGGGIMPYWRFDPVRLLHMHESVGPFVLCCEIIFIFYILYFTYKLILDIKRQGCNYFSYWAIADVSIVLTAYGCFGIYAYRYILTREILDTFKETKGNGYMKLQYVGLFDEYYGYAMGMILFIANIKLIKLLRFNNRFSQLILTLRVCWDDLSGFLGIFFLVFFAFVQLFYTILQSNMEEFHSIVASLETCFTMMLNKFKFGNMKETSMTAAVMFFFFAVSCTWILINVMLTIIMEAFEKVKDELNAKGNQYEILEFLKTHGRYVMGTENLPPKESALIDDHTEDRQRYLEDQLGIESEEESEDDCDENVTQLPEKIDSFLTYINDTYFDGDLDFKNKEILTEEAKELNLPRIIFNSDNDSGKSPSINRNDYF